MQQPNQDDTNKNHIIKLTVCHIKMDNKGSFALLEDDFDGSSSNPRKTNAAPSRKSNHSFNLAQQDSLKDLLGDTDSDEEDISLGATKFANAPAELTSTDTLSHVNGIRRRIPSAGPSGRQTVTKIRSPPTSHEQHLSSGSESDITDDNIDKKVNVLGEYDPTHYENLDISSEIKELFQYITKYIPQNLNLDYKFKPFIPDYIPAVGDIDAFLKVKQPEFDINNDKSTVDQSYLGLTVLDEPSATQSDPALLHLQLRASSINVSHTADMVVKLVDNVEKNSKTIDKWIKDITDLHRSKTSPVVKYSDPMPDLDDLMQAWPEKMETSLKIRGFPNYQCCQSLDQYIKILCCLFDIPIYKNKIQSLHLFFSLYAAIKNSQLYRAANISETNQNSEKPQGADQLVLE